MTRKHYAVHTVRDEPYQTVYPTRLSEDSKAANKWHTSAGGAWYSVGVGGDVLGRGAHIWLIDDPFGKMADAQSPVMREAVWRWFNGSVYNRLEPDGAIVIIGHRCCRSSRPRPSRRGPSLERG
jgi:hypothetical protein